MRSDDGGGGRGPDGARGSGVPDEALARRVQDGDTGAFEELVRRYLRPVHAVVASHLADAEEVEDAAQEALLRALDRIRRYDPERPFAPWLYQVARNVARNRRAARRRRRGIPLEEVRETHPSGGPSPAEEAERRELRARLEEAIAELPDAQREAFLLFDVEGMKAGRIAELTGVAEGTVRSNVYHARRALRRRLADYLDGGTVR